MPFHDRMIREAERQDADAYEREARAANAAAALQCPLATALMLEAEEQAAFCFGRERRDLLLKVAALCHEAVLQGLDIPLTGLVPRAWNAHHPEMPQDTSDGWDLATVIQFAREEAA